MAGFNEMVARVHRKITAGNGRYYVYLSAQGFMLCTHMKPVKSNIAREQYQLELLGVYTPGISLAEFKADVIYAWRVKRASN